jgi:hypothetical protein
MPKSNESDSSGLPAWDFWNRREEWAIADAALLLADIEPQSGLAARIKRAFALPDIERERDPVRLARGATTDYHSSYISDEEIPGFLLALDIYSNAWAAIRRGKLKQQNHSVAPTEFLSWAQSKGYANPASLDRADSRNREERVARTWKTRQLWTVGEAAFLLASEPPPLFAADPNALPIHVADWYRDLKDALTLGQIVMVDQRSPGLINQLLNPSDIALWARDHQRSIPAWVDTIAPPMPSRAELGARIAELEREKGGSTPRAPVVNDDEASNEGLSISTLLKLGSYLASKYRYDISSNNGAVSALQADMERTKSRALSEKTIRKVFVQGLSRYPPSEL